MSAINFVVRDSVGNVQSGSLGASNENSVFVASGSDLSLNLDPSSVLSYARQGQALQVTLSDGRVLVIEGFYTPEGQALSELFVSASGELTRVDLQTSDTDAVYAQYVESESFGKWSPDDSLYFIRGESVQVADAAFADAEVGMLATAPLLGGLVSASGLPLAAAAGLGGAVALGKTGSGGKDTTTNPKPTDPDPKPTDPAPVVGVTGGVKASKHVVNKEDHDDGVDVSGTGTSGATGTVTIDGVSKPVTIGTDGKWTATFTKEEVKGGERETEVTVKVKTAGGEATAKGIVVIDTEISASVKTSIVENDDAKGLADGVVNKAEHADGITLTGTADAGSKVVVEFNGHKQTITADKDGNWTTSWTADQTPKGEKDVPVKVTATDQAGNSATVNGIVKIDTITDVDVDTSVAGGNGTINETEHLGGTTLSGTAEAGAKVEVTVGKGDDAVTKTVYANDGGTWNANFTNTEIKPGTYDLDVSVKSTDKAGNTATDSGTVKVDTEIDAKVDTKTAEDDDNKGPRDGVVNAKEREDGITLSGTTDKDTNDLTVTLGGKAAKNVKIEADGSWTATWDADQVPTGDKGTEAEVVVTATDTAGNKASHTQTVQIDTEFEVTVDTSTAGDDGTDDKVAPDDGIVNKVERDGGLTLSGTSGKGAESITVTLDGKEAKSVTVNSDGSWTAKWDADKVPTGDKGTEAKVVVTATDDAGNTKTATDTVKIDTITDVDVNTAVAGGDGTVNKAEHASGTELKGTAEAGAAVEVTVGTGSSAVTKEVEADSNGNWTASFNSTEIKSGTYDLDVSVKSTDKAGNTATDTGTVKVDTEAPELVEAIGDTFIAGVGQTQVIVSDAEGDLTAHEVNIKTNTVTEKAIKVTEGNTYDTIDLNASGNALPDGSDLLVTDTDAAGNSTSTYIALNDKVDITNTDLSVVDIDAIDLRLEGGAELTLSTQNIKDLASNSNEVIIRGDGGSDADTVKLKGTATKSATQKTIDGEKFDVYDLGDGTSLIIDEDITFSTI